MAADIHHYIQERISPDIIDIHEEFRRVALDNGIPYIPFPKGEHPFALKDLDVRVS